MSKRDPKKLLPLLKGAPATIILTMRLYSHALTINELIVITGMARGTIKHGIERLVEFELIEEHGNGWRLAEWGGG